MNTVTEASPLLTKSATSLRQRSCCSCHVKYRLPVITEKGAVVVIVCNVLAFIAAFAQLQRDYLKTTTIVALIVISIAFPIAGIIADVCVGRFKVIQASIVLIIVPSLLNMALLLVQDYLPSTAVEVLGLLSDSICCIGCSCYIACIMPFAADQLIGASGEQLSFTMYWLMWGFAVASRTIALSCIPSGYFDIVAPAVSFLCVSTMAFILWYWKDSLETVPHLTNPIKLISRVLNYARKHKYPERRSALTYWEEHYPSRIDLGKSKYGGPFTVEEVEDVKTVFRLIPVILCAGGCCAGEVIDWYKLLISVNLFEEFKAVLAYSDIYELMIIVLGIPVYHFLIYPFFYNYIPSMLKRIGIGLVLVSCSHGISAVIGNLLLCSSQTNVTCLFSHSEMFDMSSSGLWWIILPETVYIFGFLLSMITLFEFVFAQTPHSIRGLMTGFTVLSFGLNISIGYGICQLVSIISSDVHSWFISKASLCFANVVCALLFVCISKRYKLRKRDDIIPFHSFAEDYFEKELEGQRRLERERSRWEEEINIVD